MLPTEQTDGADPVPTPPEPTPSTPAATNTSSDSQSGPPLPNPLWRGFWLGLGLAALPLLIPYFVGLWAKPTYRYFPFAIGAVAWLAYTRSDRQLYPPRGWLSWSAIGLGLLLIAAGTVLQFPWFAAVSFVIFCTAMLHAMRGHDDASLLALALPLLTLIQLVRADVLLVLSLQNITTWMSSVLLDAIAVPHAVANNVIQLADRELFVAQACSGIQSVFTLGFLSLLIVAWRRRRVWMAPLYLAIACLLAVFANVIRVTVVALVANAYQIDLAQGWPHELLGYVALAVAFAFLLSFDSLIVTLLHQVPDETEFNPLVSGWNALAVRPSEEQQGRGTTSSVAELWQRDERKTTFRWAQQLMQIRGVQIGFVACVAVLFLASLTRVIVSRRPADLIQSDSALVFDPPKDLLDDTLERLSVVNHVPNRNFEIPSLGANSDVWECEADDVKAQFVLSQPHQGWHELCDCYERLDWMLLDRNIRSPQDFQSFEIIARSPDALTATYIVARFKRGPAQFGYLIFAGIGSDGTLVEAPNSLSAFTHRVWNRIDTTGVWDQSEVIMLQMWVTTPTKLEPKRLAELEQEFIAVRGTIADAIAANAGRELPAQTAQTVPASPISKVAGVPLVGQPQSSPDPLAANGGS